MDQNSGFHGNRKPPLTYNGEKDVSTFFLFFIRSFLYLQVTRTCITSQTSSNFGQIGPLTTELAALERLKISHRLIMGKSYFHASSLIFDRIIIKVAGNQDRHKSLDEFDFGPDQTTELAALKHLKISHRLIMGKWCLNASSFIFDRIIIKVASNQDRHKSSDESDFRPDQTTQFGVTCHGMTKISQFRTFQTTVSAL